MKRHIGIILLALAAFVALLLNTVSFVVDETRDIYIVTRFGEIDRVIYGKDKPGLHWKWPYPIERLVRYDSPNHVLTSSFRQVQVADKANITAMLFVTWRIEDAAKFFRTVKTTETARQRLEALLSSEMTSVMGNVQMDQLVNTDPQKMILPQIEADIRSRVAKRAMDEYGLTLTDLGFKNLGLPESISTAVINSMKQERQKVATDYKAAGAATAAAIRGRAEAAKKKILEFARRKAGDIRTQGESKAAEAYATFRDHPEFSMFLRSLDTLRTSLAERTVILLDSDTLPILRWLRQPPKLETFNGERTEPNPQ